MTETLNIPNPFVPLETVEENNLPAVELKDQSGRVHMFDVSLPGTSEIFTDGFRVIPSALDTVESGEHTIREIEIKSIIRIGDFYPHNSTLQIEDVDGGRVFFSKKGPLGSSTDGTYDQPVLERHTGRLMSGLGFVIQEAPIISGILPGEYYDDSLILATPTPDTLKAHAKTMGVNVELFPGKSKLSAADYLGAFSRETYPVATGTDGFYQHDTGDDHLTAMVLGGEPLKTALAHAATRVLAGNEKEKEKACIDIDMLTSGLRRIISYHSRSRVPEEEFGTERGREYFLRTAGELGIDEETANSIIAEAQSKGRELGLEVKDLH